MKNSLSPSGKLTVIALLIAAVGFALQIVFALAVPTVPPGLIMLLVGAMLVAFVRQRWAPAIGVVVGVFMLFGFFASGALIHLTDASQLGSLAGAWIQFVGVIIASISGVIAVVQNY